jgi:hypothetical protein
MQSSLLGIYFSVAILTNGGAMVCITQQDGVQFEFSSIACAPGPLGQASSTPTGDCGDCSDSTLRTGETRRVAGRGTPGLSASPTVIVCHVPEQRLAKAQTCIEPESSVPSLVGSSILII